MNKGQVYARRKEFIENGIGNMMAAKKDFESIQYARSNVTEREYVRVRDIFGKAVTIEITGNDLEEVLHDMCRIILMGVEKVSAPNCVTDQTALRQLSPLFKLS